MDKLELIIINKRAELRAPKSELHEALTGMESPDYGTAGRLQPIIADVEAEIRRLENLRSLAAAGGSFQTHFSRFLTDDMLAVLEVWTEVRDDFHDIAIRLVAIKKLKRYGEISCTFRLLEPSGLYLNEEYTVFSMQHLG